MRDTKRIETICEIIRKAMMINSDIRFGQLLMNCGYIEQEVTDFGGIRTLDPYHHEDERLIKCLEDYIKEYSK